MDVDPSSDETPGTPVPREDPVASPPPVADVPPLPPEESGFSLHASRGSERDYWRIGAGIFAGLTLLTIVVFSFTDLSQGVLPMDDRYLEILIPETEPDTLPFALIELGNVLEGNRISVSGRIQNTSLEAVENVVAVIAVEETTGRFPETIEVPVEPAILEPGAYGMFSVSVTLRQRPDTYSVRFKLENGPFIPHSDERPLSFGVEPVP